MLELIKKYCENKRILIVGNSSKILKGNYSKIIDSYDIVVRINNALPLKKKYKYNIGSKTNIYSVGINNARIVDKIISESNISFILRVSPYSEKIKSKNCYYFTRKDYNNVKKHFNNYKPSSGALTVYFFDEYIKYNTLDIIGFDFFKSSNRFKKNEFKSYLYNEHSIIEEEKYIKSKITKLL